MNRIFFILLMLLITGSNQLFAQDKFEKESRIKQKEVPEKALAFITKLNINTKVKWYLETSLTKKSIEAKYKYNNLNYSIEFDTLGNIEDVEVEINWEDLSQAIVRVVNKRLSEECFKHKVVKVQQQFLGTQQELIDVIANPSDKSAVETNYELIVKCKTDKDINLFEYLFNNKGNIVSKSKIVFKNSSHLEF